VNEAVLHSGWETVLIAVPLIGILLIGIFRLDELFATPKQRPKPQRPASGMDKDGQPLLSDPDGRPWRTPRGRK